MKKLYALAFAGLLFNFQNLEAKDFQDLIKKKGNHKKTSFKTAATTEIRLPQFEDEYYWNDGTSQYDYNSSYKNYYDSKGNVILKVNFIKDTQDTTSKSSYTYNTNGETTSSLITYYDSGTDSWVNQSKSESTFDSHNNGTGYSYYNWNTTSNAWVLDYGSKSTYSYDVYGRMTQSIREEYNNTTQQWENTEKETYVYQGTNSAFIQYTDYTWDGTQWVLDEDITNIVWHNFSEFEPTSYTTTNSDGKTRTTITYSPNYVELEEIYTNNAWKNNTRSTTTTDASGNETTIFEDYVNNAWVGTEKYIEFYSSNGKDGGYESYEMNGSNWVLASFTHYTKTYDGSGNILVSERESGDVSNVWKSKSVYSNYMTFTVTNNLSANNNVTTIFAYPNPTRENVTIENLGSENKTITLYNSLNKEVAKLSTSEDKAELNLSNLVEGVYILKAESASGKVYVAKVVKQ